MIHVVCIEAGTVRIKALHVVKPRSSYTCTYVQYVITAT